MCYFFKILKTQNFGPSKILVKKKDTPVCVSFLKRISISKCVYFSKCVSILTGSKKSSRQETCLGNRGRLKVWGSLMLISVSSVVEF